MMMTPIRAVTRLMATLAALVLGAQLALAEAQHKVAIHVDEENVSTMNMALNNAANIAKHYGDLGEEVVIEIVTYGPGLHMLRADTSPVKDRIATMALEMDNISFSACLNTVEAMKQKSQKDVPLISEASVVPSGAVRLMELQKDGYAYLRP
ncbi:DsrE family protein [Seohaeicola sp. SP36]|uniref:DsrE family protein n=1 Tax=unclassified Seohaeicola TaxID=2641111 RepID=UPI00237AC7E7|nr:MULTISPECIES: DsrE family protein [unclassified Seohaeicola]MDD9708055.1 DsrE family protein [Seohaeicola sp. 4SK31]MDD9736019.1 DsrE family protein [Seohaeicola sp. SP36]